MLDLWDERRAARGDAAKRASPPVLGVQLAFPDAEPGSGLEELCVLAERATANAAFFEPKKVRRETVTWSEDWISFPSDLESDVKANDTVHASIQRGAGKKHALVVFHHWNAKKRSSRLAQYFARRGITVVQIAMPYHLERKRPDAANVDDILSPNLGGTLRSMRQAVLDGRALVRILRDAGYERISVLGMSLGSWVAGLVAAHDRAIGCAGLFLSAGSLADMVWTGRATRHIRASLDGEVGLAELRRAWAPLDLQNHATKFVREGSSLQFVLAKRDTVVPPELSQHLLNTLRAAGGNPQVLELNCGHYSLSLPPYILSAGRSMGSALSQEAQ